MVYRNQSSLFFIEKSYITKMRRFSHPVDGTTTPYALNEYVVQRATVNFLSFYVKVSSGYEKITPKSLVLPEKEIVPFCSPRIGLVFF